MLIGSRIRRYETANSNQKFPSIFDTKIIKNHFYQPVLKTHTSKPVRLSPISDRLKNFQGCSRIPKRLKSCRRVKSDLFFYSVKFKVFDTADICLALLINQYLYKRFKGSAKPYIYKFFDV